MLYVILMINLPNKLKVRNLDFENTDDLIVLKEKFANLEYRIEELEKAQ